MKRFKFQLESVLDYKRQALDALMTELSAAQAAVAAQQRARDEALRVLAEYDEKFTAHKAEGFSNVEALEYEVGQQVLVQRCQREQLLLDRRVRELEAKRRQVVEARQETRAIEKLREVRRREYDAAAAKEEEKALDDLTAARRAMAAAQDAADAE